MRRFLKALAGLPAVVSIPLALIAAVVGDLVRRGVRALEAFGRSAEVSELSDMASLPADVAPVMAASPLPG